MTQPDQIRDAQIVLLVATSRLLDVAEDVRRKRDELMDLLRQSPPAKDREQREAATQ
jgi:hypothetical protein